MLPRIRAISWFFSGSLACALAVACGGASDGSPAAGGASGAGQAGHGGSAATHSGGTGATSVECSPISLPSIGVTEEFVEVENIPEGLGGTLVDGEYEIVEHIRYRAATAGETPNYMRAALRLRDGATALDYVFVSGTVEELDTSAQGFSAGVSTAGNQLKLDSVCPKKDSFTVTFTANADALSLFEENEETRFRRVSAP